MASLVGALVLAALAALVTPAQAQGDVFLSGRVTAAGGAPIELITATLLDSATLEESGLSGQTDATGSWLIDDVPDGSYLLRFDDPSRGFVPEYYDNSMTPGGAVAIVVAGAAQTGFDAVLTAAGSIAGTIENEFGFGLPGIEVEVSSAAFTELVLTDATGGYLVDLLPPDTYTVVFVDPQFDYILEFWDDSPTVGGATPIPIPPGLDVTGIDPVLALQPGVQTCQTLEATIVGTDSSQIIHGTSGDDVIVALGGNDVIRSFGGDDTICGGTGNDLIFAGGGADLVSGEPGGDELIGHGGDDTLLGGEGDDTINGGGDADTIEGGSGSDDLNGGPGDDVVAGQGSADIVSGAVGDDVLTGGAGGDELRGNGGDDVLIGGTGDDPLLAGGAGADRVVGGPGNDVLSGNKGHDVLVGDDGDDELNGGIGEDALDGGPGTDTCSGGGDGAPDTATGCETEILIP